MDSAALNPVVVTPTYNNVATLAGVLTRVASMGLPIIAVNDGSTDGTAALLETWRRQNPSHPFQVVTHARNRGKAAALRSGFAAAIRAGHTHAFTIDTDDQHDPCYIPQLLQASQSNPQAYVLGVRDDRRSDYPARSRTGRRISNLLVRLECGLRVADSQCGFRVYPMQLIRTVPCRAGRFGYETEVITRAGWAGCPILQVPINTRYLPPEQRVSHFRPVYDTLCAIGMHVRLILRAIIPMPHARYGPGAAPSPRSALVGLLNWLNPLRAWRELRQRALDRAELATALAVGVFVANLPTYPFQTLLSLYLARRLHLNPLAVVAGSQISAPPVGPVMIAAAMFAGHFLLHGTLPPTPHVHSVYSVFHAARPLLLDWLAGSLVVGLLSSAITFVAVHTLLRRRLNTSAPSSSNPSKLPESTICSLADVQN